MKTYQAKKNEIVGKWYVVDLTDQALGRAASKVANLLRGKNRPQFTPHVDAGDFVIAVNASKMKITGNKLEQKEYYRHTGYPGGLKTAYIADLMNSKPGTVFTKAVVGMLPKNILGRQLIHKLKVYAGSEHPHSAQKPEIIS